MRHIRAAASKRLRKARGPSSGASPPPAILLHVALMMMMMVPVHTATLESELIQTYGDCYDPTNAICTCVDEIEFSSNRITGTIPSALSACAGVTKL